LDAGDSVAVFEGRLVGGQLLARARGEKLNDTTGKPESAFVECFEITLGI